ncbi:MAG: NAD(P)/FAD-dependent oxidoreductase [Candidatus Moranbacteria bacterium]|nr:NAD(P)/FAD-dependent oxidoreductase [Candidatus Moranbacteria bacterium]
MTDIFSEPFDVIVIGGGPSGMMAAGRAAEMGARVLLLEKNESLGKKLRITGGGRCNLTNATADARKMAEKFGDKGKFLLPALARFGVEATLDFFHQHELPTKVEGENRVFPASDRADDVWGALVQYMFSHKVVIQYDVRIDGFAIEDGRVIGVKMNGGVVRAKQYILATGGKSKPETGSTGDGLAWLSALGHTVIEPDTALVPITIQDPWVRNLQGTSLQKVKLSIVHKGEKRKGFEGKMLFTHFGVSGPLVLNMSRLVRERFGKGKTELSLDLFPHTDSAGLDLRLLDIFAKNVNKKLKNGLDDFTLPSLIGALIELSELDSEKPVREITRKERLLLSLVAKDMRMTVSGFLGFQKAIVSSGGVDVKEVDFKTMRSRRYPNLFLVGDILDFNRPSGGYSLQICWTTGRLAGENAAASALVEGGPSGRSSMHQARSERDERSEFRIM